MAGNEGPRDRPDRCCGFQEHPNADVCYFVTDIGNGGAAGRGDDGNNAGADRLMNRNPEHKGQHRNDDNSTAKAE